MNNSIGYITTLAVNNSTNNNDTISIYS